MEKQLWERFPSLTQIIHQDHLRQGVAVGGAHDFMHALMVAQYAYVIGKDAAGERIGELAWIAGLCHNTDRLFPNLSESEIAVKVKNYLANDVPLIDEAEQSMVAQAVLKHSRPNEPTDGTLTAVLKDADRLANIGPHWILRMAQDAPRLPVCDPRYLDTADPSATYRNPKTLFYECRCALEWEDWLRLPKARELAKPWFDGIRQFMVGLAKQLKEAGLVPYPFEDDFDRT